VCTLPDACASCRAVRWLTMICGAVADDLPACLPACLLGRSLCSAATAPAWGHVGELQVQLELLPAELALMRPCGEGRAEPNAHPT
jgi:hypothetical protein